MAARGQILRRGGGQMGGGRDLGRGAHGGRHRRGGLGIAKAGKKEGRLGLGARQHLQRDAGGDRQRAPRAGERARQVVAGDVLHHAAAGMKDLAAPGDRVHAEHMIARRPVLQPLGAGKVGGDDAAERALPRRIAEQRPVVEGIEGKLLVLRRQLRLDLGDGRAGQRGKDQFLGLVELDAGKARHVEQMAGLHRAPDGALGGLADDFQRLVLGHRPADDVAGLLRRTRLERVGHLDLLVLA